MISIFNMPRVYLYSITEEKYLDMGWSNQVTTSIEDADSYNYFNFILRYFRLKGAKSVFPEYNIVSKKIHVVSTGIGVKNNAKV